MHEIKINCKGTLEVSFSEINLIQGNLKSLNEKNFNKLKKQIFKHGFFVPFFITKLKNKIYLIDGHQRYRVIDELHSNGEIKIPDKFPAILIKSKSLSDAKVKLLAVASQYGKISKDSFKFFISDFEKIDFEDCYNFDAFNIETIFDEIEKSNEEVDINSLDSENSDGNVRQITCPYCNKQISFNE